MDEKNIDKFRKQFNELIAEHGNKSLSDIPTIHLLKMLELQLYELGDYSFATMISTRAWIDEIHKRCRR